METPDPRVFRKLEDEGFATHIAGSDEQLGGKPGGPFTLYFFTESVGGIVFDAKVVHFVGANHSVESHSCPKRAFLGRIGED